ncbi:MAG: branched-chain amino acid aminotransferase [Ruminococcaceae bacterium]|nr:branched-chain amino acid aminotransferase [Oscillospiraceae bacterium]
MEIKITKTTAPKAKPPVDSLGFGKFFTDHMFVMDYSKEQGWHDPQIIPYGPLALDPSCATLHYGQTVFEGLKAYKGANDQILLFRPYDNMNRINESNERLCIPKIDVDFAVEAIKTLVDLDKEWIPVGQGTALYIRPFIFATDPFLGVHPAATYKFIIILSPVGAYYKEGLNPVKIYVEDEYVRAVRGGMGFSKTAGNYAASLKAQEEAEKKGYTQVLWLDGVERKYIEEVGAMNIFFKIDGKVVTPALNGSILAGITRNSCLKVLNAMGIDAKEARISIQEVYEAYENGKLEEVFGTGTAAVISPVGELCWDGKKMIINNNEIGPVSQKLYDTITGIQGGKIEDTFGFTVTL